MYSWSGRQRHVHVDVSMTMLSSFLQARFEDSSPVELSLIEE